MHLFQPWSWQLFTSRQGRSLLMLSDNYDVLSLSLLSMRVGYLDVTLTSSPPACLRNLTSQEVYDKVRALLLNDFHVSGPGRGGAGSLSSDGHVCHRQVKRDADGLARFPYVCCHYGDDAAAGRREVQCGEVQRDQWIHVLLLAVLLLKVIVVLYSPHLLPGSLYRLKYATLNYVYHLSPEAPMTLRVLKTTTPWVYGNEDRVVRLHKLPGMPHFRQLVDTWPAERVQEITVQHVHLEVKARKLLTGNYVPVGLMKVLYNNLFLCRVRKIAALADCCNTNILGTLNPGLSLPSWFRCVRLLARLLLLVLLVMPWVARLLFYFIYERPVAQAKMVAARVAGLSMPFSGSLVVDLTPLHVLFVISYVILCLDSLFYGILSDAVKNKMKVVLLRCLRDMRERSKLSVCGWLTSILVMPCSRCGVVGLLLLPLYLLLLLPLLLPIVAFYLFPAINLSVRLIVHGFIFLCPSRLALWLRRAYFRLFSRVNRHMQLHTLTSDESFENKSSFSKWELPFQVVVVVMCLISFWSLTLLLMELLSFLVEVAVYTFIGLIITADVTSRYLSVIFFLLLYANRCFSSIYNKYLKYHQVLHSQLLSMMRDEIDNIARTAEMDQENTALRVQGDMAPPSALPPARLCVLDGRPRWATSSFLLFLDRQDTPYTPENFFLQTIDLNYFGCPGKLYSNFLAAFWSFGQILAFLLFVFVVVMAFGSAYSVSSTNQLLATVAGGFIPFVFTHFFSRSSGGQEVDPDSVQFKTQFHTAINGYTQNWPVFDLDLSERAEPCKATLRLEDETKRLNAFGDPPLSSSTPCSTLTSTPHAPGSTASDKAESVDWEDTTLDLILDVSQLSAAERLLGGLSSGEAGSQTMLQPGDNNNMAAGGEDGGASARPPRKFRPKEPSLQEKEELLEDASLRETNC